MLRAIREIQPKWVVGENVLGLVNWSGGLVFHEVQTDLEAQGYEVQPYVLPAAAVNAPHRRDRIWFVAYSTGRRAGSDIGGVRGVFNGCNQRKEDESLAANTNLNGVRTREGLQHKGRLDMERTILERREWGEKTDGFGIVGTDGNATNTNSDGCNKRNCEHEEQSSEGGFDAFSNIDKGDDNGNAADTGHTGLQGGAVFGGVGSSRAHENKFYSGCLPPNWDKFPTQSPICSRNDGISDRLDSITFPKWRNESIKAAGNAIVPQVVYQIFKAIEEYEQQTQQHDTNFPNTTQHRPYH